MDAEAEGDMLDMDMAAEAEGDIISVWMCRECLWRRAVYTEKNQKMCLRCDQRELFFRAYVE